MDNFPRDDHVARDCVSDVVSGISIASEPRVEPADHIIVGRSVEERLGIHMRQIKGADRIRNNRVRMEREVGKRFSRLNRRSFLPVPSSDSRSLSFRAR